MCASIDCQAAQSPNWRTRIMVRNWSFIWNNEVVCFLVQFGGISNLLIRQVTSIPFIGTNNLSCPQLVNSETLPSSIFPLTTTPLNAKCLDFQNEIGHDYWLLTLFFNIPGEAAFLSLVPFLKNRKKKFSSLIPDSCTIMVANIVLLLMSNVDSYRYKPILVAISKGMMPPFVCGVYLWQTLWVNSDMSKIIAFCIQHFQRGHMSHRISLRVKSF